MRIQPAHPDDIAVYVGFAVAAQAMLRARGLAQWVPAAHAEYRRAVESQQAAGALFGVYDDTEPLAFFVVSNAPSPWWPHDDVSALYLSGIVVSRAARGRTLGRSIVAWTLERAEAFGAQAVRLDCHHDNTWLRNYYEDLGFVLRGIVEQHPGYDGCLYEYRRDGGARTAAVVRAGVDGVPDSYDLIPDAVPPLQGAGLLLRALAEADLAPWFARLSDRESAHLAGDPIATSIQSAIDGLAYHRAALRDKRAIRWAIVPAGSAVSVGSIGLNSFNAAARSCEVGAVIGRAHWNQGVATRAGQLVIDYARDALRLRRIDAVVLAHNARVIRVLDKLGFVGAGAVPPDHEIGGAGHPSLWFCRFLDAESKEET